MKAIKEVLAAELSEDEYDRLEDLTAGWQVTPFEYCPEFDGFQTSDQWEMDHLDLAESDLDLMFRACEILSSARHEVQAPVRKENSPETMTLDFAFTEGHELDDLAVGSKFLELLQSSPAYQVQAVEFPGGIKIQVSFDYRSEVEYDRSHSDIRLLLESARKLTRQNRFSGYRL